MHSLTIKFTKTKRTMQEKVMQLIGHVEGSPNSGHALSSIQAEAGASRPVDNQLQSGKQ